MAKKIIYLILLILTLIMIFAFSSDNSEVSDGKSKKVITEAVSIYENISHKEVNKVKVVDKLNFPVRKLAHFTEFMILGIISLLNINEYKVKKKYLIALIFCLLIAISDESHQFFSVGRAPRILDVLIDFSGSAFGIFILSLIFRWRKNGKKI